MNMTDMSKADLLLHDASSGDMEKATLSSNQYAWVQRRAEQHGMSPAQFIEHMLTRLRRAEAIRKCSEQSDTFEQVTDEIRLLMPEPVTDLGEAATSESASTPARTVANHSLFDGEAEASSS